MRRRLQNWLAILTIASTGCSFATLQTAPRTAKAGDAVECQEHSRRPLIDALIAAGSLFGFAQGVNLYREGEGNPSCIPSATNPTCGSSDANKTVGMVLAITGGVAALITGLSAINGAIQLDRCQELKKARAKALLDSPKLPQQGQFFGAP